MFEQYILPVLLGALFFAFVVGVVLIGICSYGLPGRIVRLIFFAFFGAVVLVLVYTLGLVGMEALR